MGKFIFYFFMLTCGIAALTPAFKMQNNSDQKMVSFPGWPDYFERERLNQLMLSEKEKIFEETFPGRIARFSDGNREIIIRWVTQKTRKLHPAADCFKGAGFTISPRPAKLGIEKKLWGCFEADRNHEKLSVCERIYDETGASWPDVSSWYWDALLGKSNGPWWTIIVAEKIQKTQE